MVKKNCAKKGKSLEIFRPRLYIVNMGLGCIHEEASFVALDDLDNISILTNEGNDLKE